MTGQKRAGLGRVGLVANPHAGRGEEAFTAAVRGLLGRLRAVDLLLVEGTAESRIAAELGVHGRIVPPPTPTGSTAREAALLLIEAGADMLVGVGGDGTLCDIAAAIIDLEAPVRMIGVGVGSANVGPLVSMTARDASLLCPDDLHEASVHGVRAFVGGESVGPAFNDVALGNSFFGTRGGRRVDLDAAAKLAGHDRTIEPASVCGPETWVAKNGRRLLRGIDDPIAQIVASPVNEPAAYAGKAIGGLMCWGPYVGNHGVLAAASSVMIRAELDGRDVQEAEPLRLAHVCFGVDDRIEIGGLRVGAVLVLDGNPTRRLDPSDVVVLRLAPDAIRVLRLGMRGDADGRSKKGDGGSDGIPRHHR